MRIWNEDTDTPNDVLQVFDGSEWQDISIGNVFTSTTQPYRFLVRGRAWGTANARYDVYWSDPGSTLLAYSALGLSHFQKPAVLTSPMNNIRFRRTAPEEGNASGSSWYLDDVSFREVVYPKGTVFIVR